MEEEPQPKGATIVKDLLEATGVRHYDAAVVTQLLEFLYRYTSDVLESAQAHVTDGTGISHENVMLAVQAQDATQFAQPPPQEVLMKLAEARNSKPLPKFRTRHGLRLPPEEDCLLGINMQLAQVREHRIEEPQSDSAAGKGQSSARRGPQAGSRLQIRLQGDAATEAPAAPAQAQHSQPPVGQQPLAPRIAAFSGEEQEPEPGGDKPDIDVDMEELCTHKGSR